MHLLKYIGLLALGLLVGGCIKNDIPYPRIQPNFTSMEAPGLLRPAAIDSASRTVTLTFDEQTNLKAVSITSYTISADGRLTAGNLSEPINLTEPYAVTLSLYQDYVWEIVGRQDIDRYFTVANQMGEADIDVPAQKVTVKISSTFGLKQVKVLSMKLGPTGSTTVPELAGETIDLTEPVEVTVTVHGEPQVWTIVGQEVEATVVTVRADAWTNVAWIYGEALEGRDNGVEYRPEGIQQWTRAPKEWLTQTGATFYARLINLQADTPYEARCFSDSETGAEVKFTTGSEVQVPNSSLGQWSLNGKIWQPWAEGDEPYWDTGNKGATTLGNSNSVPTTDTSSGTGEGALLQSKYVGLFGIGRLAAGNIYTGVYEQTDGMNGVLSFGRPFTERPTKLRGYMKYHSAIIDRTNNEQPYMDMKGQPDTCRIYIALLDCNEPLTIRTNPKNRVLFDPQGSYVVAYGALQWGEDVADYIHFEIPLDYYATNRTPKYILIVAAASKYGDFFTGGDGSCLWLDDLELLYDY